MSAARAEPTPYRADWRRHGLTSWLATTDHKRIGILYIWTALSFFALGGILALLIRTQLATPDADVLTRNSYNQVLTIHGTTMIFLVVRPAPRRPRHLPRAADDRRAADGVPAPERPLVLALSVRRSHPLRELPRRRRARVDRLDRLRPALDAALAGQRPGLLDPRPARAHDRRARGRDQPHRHGPHHARPRDELDADAALCLVDARLRLAARDRCCPSSLPC